MSLWIAGICLLLACNLTDPRRTVASAVEVSVDRDAYTSGDTVVVSVRNATDSLITTTDHRSFCWIAQLERASSDAWEAVGPCFSMAPSAQESIAAGESKVLHVPVFTGTDAYPAVLQSGTYRWTFEYSAGATFSLLRAKRASSTDFTVR